MRGIIAAPQPLAVEEGAKVLAQGGNAIDAAVAAAFVQGLVDPQMCGLGGFGSLVVHRRPTGETASLDFYAPVPLAATPDMFVDKVAEAVEWGAYRLEGLVNDVGYLSICTPTMVKGLHQALTRFGNLSWREVIQPAITIARAGVPVYKHVHDMWVRPPSGFADNVTRHSATLAIARLYMKDGEMKGPGDIMDTADYANTLEALAEGGPEEFYQGGIARTIVADMEAHGGLLRQVDLDQCRVTAGSSVVGTYRGYTVYGPPPPGAGVLVIEALNILSGFDLGQLQHNGSQHLHILAEAMRLGFVDWKRNVGDPEFVDNPVEWLVSQGRAAELGSRISGVHEPLTVTQGSVAAPDSPYTTHVSVMDIEGNAISLTHSLGMGSGVVTEGLGFQYNDALVLFDPYPGRPNSIAPGRVRQHAISCCLLLKDGQPVISIGAPGGHGIVSGVVQAISNIVDFGMTPVEAVSAPRIHCEGDTIEAEARIPRDVVTELVRLGHTVNHAVYSYGYSSGRVHLVAVDVGTGAMTGGADPRGGGMALLA